MKKVLISLTLIILASSCSYKYTPSSSAMINITDYNIGDTNLLRTGEACRTEILGISGESSTSVIDAMKNGNISKIKMVDKKNTIFFPFFVKNCTVVHGL